MDTMRLEAAVAPDVEEQLGQDLRAMVIAEVTSTPSSKTALAQAFAVPEESVDRMIAATRWDLPLAVSAAQHLGVRVHVTRSD